MKLLKKIDEKHSIVIEAVVLQHLQEFGIVKHTNGEMIDLEKEPVILFRGRDKLALPMLEFYRDLCVNDGCTSFQLESMDKMIEKFRQFGGIKQPGCTLGA